MNGQVVSSRPQLGNDVHLRTILDASHHGIILLSPEGATLFQNRTCAEMFGYTQEEIAGLSFVADLVAPEDAERLASLLSPANRGRLPGVSHLLGMVRKGGGRLNACVDVSEVEVEVDGQLTGHMVEFRDVTGELRDQRAHAETEARLRALMDASQSALGFMPRDGSPTSRNRAYAEMLGYELAEMEGASPEDFVAPYEMARVRAWRTDTANGNWSDEPFLVDFVHRNGRILNLLCHTTNAEIDGEVIGWVTDARDVTDDLAARRELEEREAQLTRGQEFAHVGTWSIDIATGEQRWTSELYRLYGLEPGSVTPSNTAVERFMDPDDREHLFDAMRAVDSADDSFDVHVRTVGADGIDRTLWIRSELTRDGQGRPLRWDGATQDVTDLLRAQESIAERERFLSSTLEAVQSGVLVSGRGSDARIISANPQAADILGYSQEELEGVDLSTLLPKEEQPQMLERRRARAQGRMGAVRARYRAQRKDGRWIDIEARSAPLIRDGEFEGSVASIRDVTAELALQREVEDNAERLNAVFETVSTGLIIFSLGERPTAVNRAACAIWGYERNELMSKTLTELVPSDEIDHARVMFRAIVESGTTYRRHLSRALTRDGRSIDVEVSAEPFWLGGELVGVVAEIRDVTEQKNAERELSRLHSEIEERSRERQALVRQLLTAQEEERRAVAYDIHDGPTQQLTGVQMLLWAFAQDKGLEKVDQAPLNHANARLAEALSEIRRIMSGLRPALLDDLGLSEALSQLLVELTDRAGVQLEIRLNGLAQQLPPEIEISIYRIVQEAARNALKHSGTPLLTVELASHGTAVSVVVEDCGVGFDPQAVSGPTEGRHYGLVGMRERVTLLDGQFEVESRVGKGTRVTATIPLPLK